MRTVLFALALAAVLLPLGAALRPTLPRGQSLALRQARALAISSAAAGASPAIASAAAEASALGDFASKPPLEQAVGYIFVAYVGFSLLAGLKGVVEKLGK